jgi:biotin carboxyl carrier protein
LEASASEADAALGVRVAEAAVHTAEANLREAEQSIKRSPGVVSEFEMRRIGLELERAKAQLDQARAGSGVAQRMQEKRMAEAKLAKAELARHRIVAPRDGVLVKWHVAEGSWVRAGDPICRVVAMDRLRAEAFIPSRDAGELLGREVKISVELSSRDVVRLSSRIGYVSPVVESGEIRCWAELENPVKRSSPVLRPGMHCTMTIQPAQSTLPPNDDAGEPLEPDLGQYTPEEIGYLTELVASYEAMWKQILARHEAGAAGGEAQNEAAARKRLHMARARLALAQRERSAAIEHYQSAIQAAVDQVSACQKAYQNGSASAQDLMEAEAERAELKLQLSRLKRG